MTFFLFKLIKLFSCQTTNIEEYVKCGEMNAKK